MSLKTCFPGQWWYTLFIQHSRDSSREISEFRANLVLKMNSRTVRKTLSPKPPLKNTTKIKHAFSGATLTNQELVNCCSESVQ